MVNKLFLAFLFCLVLINTDHLSAQTSFSLSKNISQAVVHTSSEGKQHPRILNLKKLPLQKKINPLLYLGSGLMYVYQNIFSQQLNADCVYATSCSNYTKLCIEKNGFIKGSLQGFNQFFDCHPFVMHETESHLIGKDLKVINPIY